MKSVRMLTETIKEIINEVIDGKNNSIKNQIHLIAATIGLDAIIKLIDENETELINTNKSPQEKLYSVSQIAEEYGKTGAYLNNFLYEKGILFRVKGNWKIHQLYDFKGYTKNIKSLIYWTDEGKKFINNLLKSYKVIPFFEQINTHKKGQPHV